MRSSPSRNEEEHDQCHEARRRRTRQPPDTSARPDREPRAKPLKYCAAKIPAGEKEGVLRRLSPWRVRQGASHRRAKEDPEFPG
jgi:hypothetical protein